MQASSHLSVRPSWPPGDGGAGVSAGEGAPLQDVDGGSLPEVPGT